MPVVRVAPNSDIQADWGAAAPNWSDVDDLVADDDTTVIIDTGLNVVDRYGLDVTGLDPQERITAVQATIRHEPGGGTGSWAVTPGMVVNGVTYNWAEIAQSVGAGWNTFTRDQDLNPNSGLRWTRDALRNAQLRIESTEIGVGMPGQQVTQFVLDVTTQPQSKLIAIKDYIADRISRISGIGSWGTKLKAWHEVVNFPAVYTVIGSETKAGAPTRSKEGQAQFLLPTVVKSEDPLESFMELYEKIEEIIEDDPSLDTLALNAQVTGFNALVTSDTIAGQVHVADVFLTVDYRHTRGNA